jgi:hypothetical protein
VNILKFLREQAKDYDCGKCGTNHARSDIRLLGKLDTAWIVRVTCSKCETSFKLLVYVDRQRATVSPVKEEPARSRRPALSADDVIDAHDFLESFQGDAKGLFATRGKVGRTPEPR